MTLSRILILSGHEMRSGVVLLLSIHKSSSHMNTPASSGWMRADFLLVPILPTMSSSSKIFTCLLRSRWLSALAFRMTMGSDGSSCDLKYSVMSRARSGQSQTGESRSSCLMRVKRPEDALPCACTACFSMAAPPCRKRRLLEAASLLKTEPPAAARSRDRSGRAWVAWSCIPSRYP